MVVALSTFSVANGMAEDVKHAFRARPHLVEQAPGFIRMEVFTARDKPEEFWLVTYWRDETSFQIWHHSEAHHASHGGIPKGLKLVRGSTRVRLLDHVTS